LVVRVVDKHIIDAEIVNGTHVGDGVFIPRTLMSPFEHISLPFKFKRKHFPVRLSFMMTINKAQGQMLPTVSLYLLEPVFSHGQLYDALLRGVSQGSTWVLYNPRMKVDIKGNSTRNLVYTNVLGT
jgi:ATP-dependent DNA helicase PIF1